MRAARSKGPPLSLSERRRRFRKGSVTARASLFRPCIDIHEGKVKQIVGSSLKDAGASGGVSSVAETNFESDRGAGYYARLYREHELVGGHVIMLDGWNDDTVHAAQAALRAYPGGLQVGGGLNNENAGAWIELGASHVIVTSFAFRDGNLDRERLASLVDAVGRERLVLDLSCRLKDGEYYVVTDRWQKFSSLRLDAASVNELATYCDEFLVHGVDVEGKKLGVDEALISLLGELSPIPVTYAGGVRSMGDLAIVDRAGSGRVEVTVGSALDIFGGDMAFDDVVAWHNDLKTSRR